MLRPKNHGGMGFRDMRLFNQALLACHAWRLIQFPDTLCAQVLKAKYYPNGALIDTVFGGNGSSTWHAIEYGLELLKKGILWRVGNGASIRAWRDPWIPRDFSHQPISSKRRCRHKWVGDFLLPDGEWNVPRLEEFFLPIDLSEILKIKTSTRGEADFLAWHPEKRGMFTVKSAYRLGLDEHLRMENSGSSSARPDGERPWWKLIWQCPVRPKARVLTWKIARNALATQVNCGDPAHHCIL